MQRGPPRRPSGGTGAQNPGDGGTPLGAPIASGATFQPASLQQFIIGPGQVQAVQTVNIASPTTQSQSTSNRPQLVAGMMVMPPLSPSRGYQQATLINHASPPAGSGHMSLFIQPQEGHELQIVRSQPTTVVTQTSPVPVAYPVTSTVSASGSTIHHHGQSPVRGGIPPLANPTTQTSPQNIIATMNVHQQLGLLASQQQTIGQIQAHLTQSPPQQQTMRRLSGSSATGTSHKLVGDRVGPLSNPSLLTLQNPRTSPAQSPDRPRKKIKLEEVNPATAEIGTFRKLICDERLKQMKEIKENYNEHLTEIFFLQAGGNIMDYHSWKKRPTVQLLNFLKSSNLDSDDDEEVVQQEKKINNEVKVITTSGGTMPLATPVAISTTLPAAITAMQLQGQGPDSAGKKLGGRHGMVFGHVTPQHSAPPPQMPGGIPLVTSSGTTMTSSSSILPLTTANSISTSAVTASTGVSSTSSMNVPAVTTPVTTTVTTTMSSQLAKAMAEATSSRTPVTSSHSSVALSSSLTPKTPKTPLSPSSSRLATRQHSISAVYDSAIGSQEAIVERAKQEAQVMQRIAELRKEGMWSSRRLPKVQEPARNKAHWDYLLEEMQWLAADFAQERKWKKAGARKIARMISRYHQEQQQKELRAEKEEGQKLKRISSSMAKMVREFWSNIEKVVQYKQQSRLEEKRKKALDLHLSFIVDQTEKYSSWLSEGLTKNRAGSITSSITASPAHSSGIEDVEFDPNQSSTDDEETIERAEAEDVCDEEDKKNEIEALQRESEMPLDELLRTLPREVLDKPASIDPSGQSGDEGDDEESKKGDEEFQVSDSGEDDEETIEAAEKQEKSDHKQEIKELEDEGDMPIEELMQKYAGAYDSDFETQMSVDVTETEEETEEETDEEEEEEEEDEEEEEETDEEEVVQEVGMEYLINPDTDEEPSPKKKDGPSTEITDIAAAAQSLQPTGYTLETTQVKTTVPFLLKHGLREYQHVGLDWLATMHDRKLNGILADEMGLGKTIQTIAMLAHLACDKEVWGPHLIVVPTSVMLNWEMELKKWCPAFKILTYYGNQKERKQKRQGWTKTNAFHVCITSYKLVIQDHQSFRRKKWRYFILDEAQNIKNFRSQRWQTLLNFSSQRRLLLTGTPLQNSLMELWSLMHFLMPHVFASHREFKEWFSNPLSGMIEGSREYNENLIKRLHKVLRPFLLRRLKQDVEKQMPKKYEHIVMCRLSKRQRFLYDDFMSKTKTKETLASGHFMSVINILMQLRKVCNHPNLFDPRPILSPFQMEGFVYHTASLVLKALELDPFEQIDMTTFNPLLADTELSLSAYAAHRIKKLQTPRRLIEEIDTLPDPPPRLNPTSKPVKLAFRSPSPLPTSSGRSSPFIPIQHANSPLARNMSPSPVTTTAATGVTSASSTVSSAVTSVLVNPVVAECVATPSVSQTQTQPMDVTAAQRLMTAKLAPQVNPAIVTPPASSTVSMAQQVLTSQPITVQIHHTQQGTRLMIPSGQLSQLPPGFIQIVQTSSGQQIIATSQQPQVSQTTPVQQVHPVQQSVAQSVLNGPSSSVTTSLASSGSISARPVPTTTLLQLPTTPGVTAAKPVMRVQPLTQAQPLQTNPAVSTASNILKMQTSQAVKQPDVAITTTSIATASSSSPLITTSTTRSVISTRSQAKSFPTEKPKQKSPLYLECLAEKREQRRRDKLERIARLNRQNCEVKPVYGEDLCRAVNILHDKTWLHPDQSSFNRMGYVHCNNVRCCKHPNHPANYWRQTEALARIVHSPEMYLTEMKDILDRYAFTVPTVMAPCIRMHTSHPPPSLLLAERRQEFILHQSLVPRAAGLHKISTNMTVQFPELRLIQYDCGKLQTMDILLRQLKSGGHRVLIFTQMTKMLDVLEAFLNYHGHRYLRLDGTTKVEQRQALMERFNMDRRIFCFILSTRSGGIGVNLTGADTVIFYDSDWNPTMDAQAQDRCHRIGQTRDVHIYRLISEKTVEENILKKANQKRLLGDVAIEGGNFTTAFFKEGTIKELFEEPSGLEQFAKDQTEKKEQMEQERSSRSKSRALAASTVEPTASKPSLTQDQIEQALCQAEDDTDVQAVKVVKAEQKAELAEFDENIPWDEKEAEQKGKKDDDMSKVEQEIAMLEKELTPVERFAVIFLETQMKPFATEELEKAEEEVTIAKEEWEFSRLKALKEEEERRAELEEDEMLFTYTREDALNQVNKKKKKATNAKANIKNAGTPDNEPHRRSARSKNRRSSVGSTGSRGGQTRVSTPVEEIPALSSNTEDIELVAKPRVLSPEEKARVEAVRNEQARALLNAVKKVAVKMTQSKREHMQQNAICKNLNVTIPCAKDPNSLYLETTPVQNTLKSLPYSEPRTQSVIVSNVSRAVQSISQKESMSRPSTPVASSTVSSRVVTSVPLSLASHGLISNPGSSLQVCSAVRQTRRDELRLSSCLSQSPVHMDHGYADIWSVQEKLEHARAIQPYTSDPDTEDLDDVEIYSPPDQTNVLNLDTDELSTEVDQYESYDALEIPKGIPARCVSSAGSFRNVTTTRFPIGRSHVGNVRSPVLSPVQPVRTQTSLPRTPVASPLQLLQSTSTPFTSTPQIRLHTSQAYGLQVPAITPLTLTNRLQLERSPEPVGGSITNIPVPSLDSHMLVGLPQSPLSTSGFILPNQPIHNVIQSPMIVTPTRQIIDTHIHPRNILAMPKVGTSPSDDSRVTSAGASVHDNPESVPSAERPGEAEKPLAGMSHPGPFHESLYVVTDQDPADEEEMQHDDDDLDNSTASTIPYGEDGPLTDEDLALSAEEDKSEVEPLTSPVERSSPVLPITISNDSKTNTSKTDLEIEHLTSPVKRSFPILMIPTSNESMANTRQTESEVEPLSNPVERSSPVLTIPTINESTCKSNTRQTELEVEPLSNPLERSSPVLMIPTSNESKSNTGQTESEVEPLTNPVERSSPVLAIPTINKSQSITRQTESEVEPLTNPVEHSSTILAIPTSHESKSNTGQTESEVEPLTNPVERSSPVLVIPTSNESKSNTGQTESEVEPLTNPVERSSPVLVIPTSNESKSNTGQTESEVEPLTNPVERSSPVLMIPTSHESKSNTGQTESEVEPLTNPLDRSSPVLAIPTINESKSNTGQTESEVEPLTNPVERSSPVLAISTINESKSNTGQTEVEPLTNPAERSSPVLMIPTSHESKSNTGQTESEVEPLTNPLDRSSPVLAIPTINESKSNTGQTESEVEPLTNPVEHSSPVLAFPTINESKSNTGQTESEVEPLTNPVERSSPLRAIPIGNESMANTRQTESEFERGTSPVECSSPVLAIPISNESMANTRQTESEFGQLKSPVERFSPVLTIPTSNESMANTRQTESEFVQRTSPVERFSPVLTIPTSKESMATTSQAKIAETLSPIPKPNMETGRITTNEGPAVKSAMESLLEKVINQIGERMEPCNTTSEIAEPEVSVVEDNVKSNLGPVGLVRYSALDSKSLSDLLPTQIDDVATCDIPLIDPAKVNITLEVPEKADTEPDIKETLQPGVVHTKSASETYVTCMQPLPTPCVIPSFSTPVASFSEAASTTTMESVFDVDQTQIRNMESQVPSDINASPLEQELTNLVEESSVDLDSSQNVQSNENPTEFQLVLSADSQGYRTELEELQVTPGVQVKDNLEQQDNVEQLNKEIIVGESAEEHGVHYKGLEDPVEEKHYEIEVTEPGPHEEQMEDVPKSVVEDSSTETVQAMEKNKSLHESPLEKDQLTQSSTSLTCQPMEDTILIGTCHTQDRSEDVDHWNQTDVEENKKVEDDAGITQSTPPVSREHEYALPVMFSKSKDLRPLGSCESEPSSVMESCESNVDMTRCQVQSSTANVNEIDQLITSEKEGEELGSKVSEDRSAVPSKSEEMTAIQGPQTISAPSVSLESEMLPINHNLPSKTNQNESDTCQDIGTSDLVPEDVTNPSTVPAVSTDLGPVSSVNAGNGKLVHGPQDEDEERISLQTINLVHSKLTVSEENKCGANPDPKSISAADHTTPESLPENKELSGVPEKSIEKQQGDFVPKVKETDENITYNNENRTSEDMKSVEELTVSSSSHSKENILYNHTYYSQEKPIPSNQDAEQHICEATHSSDIDDKQSENPGTDPTLFATNCDKQNKMGTVENQTMTAVEKYQEFTDDNIKFGQEKFSAIHDETVSYVDHKEEAVVKSITLVSSPEENKRLTSVDYGRTDSESEIEADLSVEGESPNHPRGRHMTRKGRSSQSENEADVSVESEDRDCHRKKLTHHTSRTDPSRDSSLDEQVNWHKTRSNPKIDQKHKTAIPDEGIKPVKRGRGRPPKRRRGIAARVQLEKQQSDSSFTEPSKDAKTTGFPDHRPVDKDPEKEQARKRISTHSLDTPSVKSSSDEEEKQIRITRSRKSVDAEKDKIIIRTRSHKMPSIKILSPGSTENKESARMMRSGKILLDYNVEIEKNAEHKKIKSPRLSTDEDVKRTHELRNRMDEKDAEHIKAKSPRLAADEDENLKRMVEFKNRRGTRSIVEDNDNNLEEDNLRELRSGKIVIQPISLNEETDSKEVTGREIEKLKSCYNSKLSDDVTTSVGRSRKRTPSGTDKQNEKEPRMTRRSLRGISGEDGDVKSYSENVDESTDKALKFKSQAGHIYIKGHTEYKSEGNSEVESESKLTLQPGGNSDSECPVRKTRSRQSLQGDEKQHFRKKYNASQAHSLPSDSEDSNCGRRVSKPISKASDVNQNRTSSTLSKFGAEFENHSSQTDSDGSVVVIKTLRGRLSVDDSSSKDIDGKDARQKLITSSVKKEKGDTIQTVDSDSDDSVVEIRVRRGRQSAEENVWGRSGSRHGSEIGNSDSGCSDLMKDYAKQKSQVHGMKQGKKEMKTNSLIAGKVNKKGSNVDSDSDSEVQEIPILTRARIHEAQLAESLVTRSRVHPPLSSSTERTSNRSPRTRIFGPSQSASPRNVFESMAASLFQDSAIKSKTTAKPASDNSQSDSDTDVNTPQTRSRRSVDSVDHHKRTSRASPGITGSLELGSHSIKQSSHSGPLPSAKRGRPRLNSPKVTSSKPTHTLPLASQGSSHLSLPPSGPRRRSSVRSRQESENDSETDSQPVSTRSRPPSRRSSARSRNESGNESESDLQPGSTRSRHPSIPNNTVPILEKMAQQLTNKSNASVNVTERGSDKESASVSERRRTRSRNVFQDNSPGVVSLSHND